MLLRNDEDFNQESMSWTSAAYWFSFNSIQLGKKEKTSLSERLFYLCLVKTYTS